MGDVVRFIKCLVCTVLQYQVPKNKKMGSGHPCLLYLQNCKKTDMFDELATPTYNPISPDEAYLDIRMVTLHLKHRSVRESGKYI